jgi:hypothetical protein
MKVALVCIAKNEDNYIKEWCDYHLKLGFDSIFIYQNNWRTDINLNNVHKIEFDGEVKQLESYNDFIKKERNNYNWVAFFDVDEFLVLKKHNNVKDFISQYSDYRGIGINWCIFGDNGHEEIDDNNYSLIDRFTRREKEMDQHVKSIVRLNNNNLYMNVHNPNHPIVNTLGNEFTGPFNMEKDDSIAQLNHYFCKTKKEFEEKIKRGRSDVLFSRDMNEFDLYNKNEIDDFSAHNFYFKK